jgi:RHS repeat-associated protein
MTQATGPGGTVTYTLDGDGVKTRRVGPDGTTKYYYDGIRPIWETDSGGAMTAQLDRDIFGNLLSRKEPTVRRYYHFDGLGSTTALTNESGTMVATTLYDAWGLQRTSSGSGHGKYRYTGAEMDTASGFYHMGARFYDPSLGRWLSEDPVHGRHFEPTALNFYSYVTNNPMTSTDPTGLLEGESGSPPASRSLGQIVLDWVREFGPVVALRLVREAWDAINKVIDALEEAGWYADLNLTAALLGGFTGGVIHDANSHVYAYFGVAIGLGGGITYTIGVHGVTEGWNIAMSPVFPNGFAAQLGSVLGCFTTCGYREYGLGYGAGLILAIFKVTRMW